MTGRRFTPTPGLPVAVLLGLLLGCSTKSAVRAPNEPMRVQRLAVDAFQGRAGAEITRDFVAALQQSGFQIVERSQKPDAILVGAITDVKTGRKLIIFLGNTQTLTGDQMQPLSNPILTGSGGAVVPQTPASGSSPRVVTEHASIQIRVRLFDPGGKPLWASEYSYEALALETAKQAVIGALTRALRRSAPELRPS